MLCDITEEFSSILSFYNVLSKCSQNLYDVFFFRFNFTYFLYFGIYFSFEVLFRMAFYLKCFPNTRKKVKKKSTKEML